MGRFYVNRAVLQLWSPKTVDINLSEIHLRLDLSHVKMNAIVEFVAFLYGDHLPESKDRIRPYYNLCQQLGVSISMLPKYYHPKTTDHLKGLISVDSDPILSPRLQIVLPRENIQSWGLH